MTLRFPYLDETLRGPAPPSLPAGSLVRWRPLVPVAIHGPRGRWLFTRAVLDTGSDDTIFPLSSIHWIGAALRPDSGHRIRWRGQLHPLRFADIELELDDGSGKCRWPAIVAFSPAPMTYPLLGLAGCLEFFDARFHSADRLAELETNRVYPGSTS